MRNLATKVVGVVVFACAVLACNSPSPDDLDLPGAADAAAQDSAAEASTRADGSVDPSNGNDAGPDAADAGPEQDGAAVEDAGPSASPVNVAPENGAELTDQEASGSVTFRWTPLVPKPPQSTTYRLKVWQLMQGQSGATAMRSNPPIVTKDVADVSEVAVDGIYTGPCKPPYLCDFIWSVEASNAKGALGEPSAPTTFHVTDHTGLSNVAPKDAADLSDREAKGEVTFRWTPLVPKPKDPVTYRLKVWQLMQGQNGTAAMKSNPPIVTKDVVDGVEVVVAGVVTGPCRPPYLCDFVWSVDASTAKGALGQPSPPTGFHVTEYTGPTNLLPAEATDFTDREAAANTTFTWTPLVPKPKEPATYRLRVWQLMQGQNGAQAMKSNAPIATKSVVDASQVSVSGIVTGPCKPPYLCDFVWSVDASIASGPLGEPSLPTTFHVTDYSGLANLSPADDAIIPPKEALDKITFQWSPMLPKPAQPVMYVLRVWQLEGGQTEDQAMATNPPVVTKSVIDATQGDVSGLYTGPCKPPYLCDFVWSVSASTQNRPMGQPSTPTGFSIK